MSDIHVRTNRIFNTALVYSLNLKNNLIHPIIAYNRKNVQLKVDFTKNLPSGFSIETYRDLNKSEFANTFLRLENLKNDSYDFESKFSGLNRFFEKDIYISIRELHNLRTGKSSDTITNYLLLLVFRFTSASDEYAYMLLQRRSYIKETHMNTIRSMGIEFSTERGRELMHRYKDSYKEKVQNIKKRSSLPDFLSMGKDND